MNPEQNLQSQEQINQEQTVEAPKGPETVEELRSRVDAQKQQLQKELEDIIKRSQEFSAKQQGSEIDPALVAGAQTELDKLDKEAQITVEEANVQLDKITTSQENEMTEQQGTTEFPNNIFIGAEVKVSRSSGAVEDGWVVDKITSSAEGKTSVTVSKPEIVDGERTGIKLEKDLLLPTLIGMNPVAEHDTRPVDTNSLTESVDDSPETSTDIKSEVEENEKYTQQAKLIISDISTFIGRKYLGETDRSLMEDPDEPQMDEARARDLLLHFGLPTPQNLDMFGFSKAKLDHMRLTGNNDNSDFDRLNRARESCIKRAKLIRNTLYSEGTVDKIASKIKQSNKKT